MFMICQGAYDGKLNFVHRACVMSYISQYINLIRCFMCYAWLTSCILIPCGCCHGRAVQKQWTFDSMSFNIWDFFSPRLRFSIGHCYFITLALTTQKTLGAIIADVELIVTDDDTMHIEGTARCAADTDPAQAIQHVGASIQIVGASIVLQIRQGQRLSDRDDMVWHTSRAFPVAE